MHGLPPSPPRIPLAAGELERAVPEATRLRGAAGAALRALGLVSDEIKIPFSMPVDHHAPVCLAPAVLAPVGLLVLV